ncbi:MAG: hypothetical protein JO017_09765, partial [Actinobacteria bacterium]|nr:hypothetical protein [Actinomycetota bacterium]
GKTVDGLVAALVAAEKTELDGRVSSGQLTQAQEDTIVPTLTQRFTDFVNGTGRPGPGPGGPGGPGGDDFAAAASYLGLTTAALQSDLQGGQTLAQVAGSTSGKTVDGLVAALVAAEKTELDGRVSSGQLTQAQEDTIVPTLTQRFTHFVNGTGRPGPGH